LGTGQIHIRAAYEKEIDRNRIRVQPKVITFLQRRIECEEYYWAERQR
jgi:hypothetical protein